MKFAIDHGVRLPPAAASERSPNTAPSAEASASLHRFVEFTPDLKVLCGAEAGVQA